MGLIWPKPPATHSHEQPRPEAKHTFPVKGQTVSILGFAATVSISTTQHCRYHTKAVTKDKRNECSGAAIKLRTPKLKLYVISHHITAFTFFSH